MHELSLAGALVDSILEFAESKGARRVISVEVRVSELAQLDINLLREAYYEMVKGTIAEDSRLEVKVVSTEFKCNNCGKKWTLNDVRRALFESASSYRIADEDGTLDLPTHYVPMAVHALITCPSCGSTDFSANMPRSLKVTKIEIER
ncbi:MAG: hypothetical protein DRJ41_00850 [Thermoprotei archaeon]|nr:MAG: hypothetical protein DRJ41_00850 [Thermoprotei archaeon]